MIFGCLPLTFFLEPPLLGSDRKVWDTGRAQSEDQIDANHRLLALKEVTTVEN